MAKKGQKGKQACQVGDGQIRIIYWNDLY